MLHIARRLMSTGIRQMMFDICIKWNGKLRHRVYWIPICCRSYNVIIDNCFALPEGSSMHLNILISHLSLTVSTWILIFTFKHRMRPQLGVWYTHHTYNGRFSVCIARDDFNISWYIYLWKKTTNMCARIFGDTKVSPCECVCARGEHYKHSLCIGRRNSGTNNLSINQVHYSLHRICKNNTNNNNNNK